MAKYRTERLDPGAYAEWDAFVAAQPDGSFFHTTGWLLRFADRADITAAYDAKGAILGGAALVRTSKFGVSGYHIPPYTPLFGPVIARSGKNRAASALLGNINAAAAVLDALPRGNHYDFTFPLDGEISLLPYLWKGYTAELRYSTLIQGTEGDYWNAMVRRKRFELTSARRGIEDGTLVVDRDGPLEDLFPLSGEVSRLKGFRFNPRLCRAVFPAHERGARWTLHLVRDRSGRCLAGSVLYFDGRRGYALLNGVAADRRTSISDALILTMDGMIRECLSRGLPFDFEGSILKGVAEFFIMLGGAPYPQVRLQKSPSLRYFLMRTGRRWREERRG
ncbi:MAG TPA: hypothetical protein DCS11_00245 [Syntrophus sp. (in: bacteria)]|jgi:hypothetical protein|nr:hypothetical protein [Syntrophus sp. (in: bacteria)]